MVNEEVGFGNGSGLSVGDRGSVYDGGFGVGAGEL